MICVTEKTHKSIAHADDLTKSFAQRFTLKEPKLVLNRLDEKVLKSKQGKVLVQCLISDQSEFLLPETDVSVRVSQANRHQNQESDNYIPTNVSNDGSMHLIPDFVTSGDRECSVIHFMMNQLMLSLSALNSNEVDALVNQAQICFSSSSADLPSLVSQTSDAGIPSTAVVTSTSSKSVFSTAEKLSESSSRDIKIGQPLWASSPVREERVLESHDVVASCLETMSPVVASTLSSQRSRTKFPSETSLKSKIDPCTKTGPNNMASASSDLKASPSNILLNSPNVSSKTGSVVVKTTLDERRAKKRSSSGNVFEEFAHLDKSLEALAHPGKVLLKSNTPKPISSSLSSRPKTGSFRVELHRIPPKTLKRFDADIPDRFRRSTSLEQRDKHNNEKESSYRKERNSSLEHKEKEQKDVRKEPNLSDEYKNKQKLQEHSKKEDSNRKDKKLSLEQPDKVKERSDRDKNENGSSNQNLPVQQKYREKAPKSKDKTKNSLFNQKQKEKEKSSDTLNDYMEKARHKSTDKKVKSKRRQKEKEIKDARSERKEKERKAEKSRNKGKEESQEMESKDGEKRTKVVGENYQKDRSKSNPKKSKSLEIKQSHKERSSVSDGAIKESKVDRMSMFASDEEEEVMSSEEVSMEVTSQREPEVATYLENSSKSLASFSRIKSESSQESAPNIVKKQLSQDLWGESVRYHLTSDCSTPLCRNPNEDELFDELDQNLSLSKALRQEQRSQISKNGSQNSEEHFQAAKQAPNLTQNSTKVSLNLEKVAQKSQFAIKNTNCFNEGSCRLTPLAINMAQNATQIDSESAQNTNFSLIVVPRHRVASDIDEDQLEIVVDESYSDFKKSTANIPHSTPKSPTQGESTKTTSEKFTLNHETFVDETMSLQEISLDDDFDNLLDYGTETYDSDVEMKASSQDSTLDIKDLNFDNSEHVKASNSIRVGPVPQQSESKSKMDQSPERSPCEDCHRPDQFETPNEVERTQLQLKSTKLVFQYQSDDAENESDSEVERNSVDRNTETVNNPSIDKTHTIDNVNISTKNIDSNTIENTESVGNKYGIMNESLKNELNIKHQIGNDGDTIAKTVTSYNFERSESEAEEEDVIFLTVGNEEFSDLDDDNVDDVTLPKNDVNLPKNDVNKESKRDSPKDEASSDVARLKLLKKERVTAAERDSVGIELDYITRSSMCYDTLVSGRCLQQSCTFSHRISPELIFMYSKIVRNVSFDNLPTCLKGSVKKNCLEGVLHIYQVHKDGLTSSGRRMELLSQALDDLLKSGKNAAPLLFKVEDFVKDLYDTYHCKIFMFSASEVDQIAAACQKMALVAIKWIASDCDKSRSLQCIFQFIIFIILEGILLPDMSTYSSMLEMLYEQNEVDKTTTLLDYCCNLPDFEVDLDIVKFIANNVINQARVASASTLPASVQDCMEKLCRILSTLDIGNLEELTGELQALIPISFSLSHLPEFGWTRQLLKHLATLQSLDLNVPQQNFIKECDVRIDSISALVSSRLEWPELVEWFRQIQVQDVKKLQKFFLVFFESVEAASSEQVNHNVRLLSRDFVAIFETFYNTYIRFVPYPLPVTKSYLSQFAATLIVYLAFYKNDRVRAAALIQSVTGFNLEPWSTPTLFSLDSKCEILHKPVPKDLVFLISCQVLAEEKPLKSLKLMQTKRSDVIDNKLYSNEIFKIVKTLLLRLLNPGGLSENLASQILSNLMTLYSKWLVTILYKDRDKINLKIFERQEMVDKAFNQIVKRSLEIYKIKKDNTFLGTLLSFIEDNQEGSLTSKLGRLSASLNEASVRAIVFVLQNENRTSEAVKFLHRGKALNVYEDLDCNRERTLVRIPSHLTQFEVEVALHDALDEFSRFIGANFDVTSDQMTFQVSVIRPEVAAQKTGFGFLDCNSVSNFQEALIRIKRAVAKMKLNQSEKPTKSSKNYKTQKNPKSTMIELAVPSVVAYLVRKSKADFQMKETQASQALEAKETGRNLKNKT